MQLKEARREAACIQLEIRAGSMAKHLVKHLAKQGAESKGNMMDEVKGRAVGYLPPCLLHC